MSEECHVKYGEQSLSFRDNDHYHAALKASHVLLEEGRLKKYSSSQGETITVHGMSVTQVYKAWKSQSSNGMQIPEIECTRTFVNDNWFSDPKNSFHSDPKNEFIASMPSIPNIVNCAEDLLPVMSSIWGFPSYKGQQADAITSIIKGRTAL